MEEELQRHIKPGEFTFCSRCGKNCHIGNVAFMCTSCKASLFSKEESELERGGRFMRQTAEKRISDIIREFREALAKHRRESQDGQSC